jgi:hypothetical protein
MGGGNKNGTIGMLLPTRYQTTNFKVEVTHAKQGQYREERGASLDVRNGLVEFERISYGHTALWANVVRLQAAK